MSMRQHTHRLFAGAAIAGAALLSGCASLRSVDVNVASYGAWPAGTTPGTYAFERLPSQDARPQRQLAIENDAAPALAAAGFVPAPAGAKPALIVQIGVRTERFEQDPWDDPFWWGGRRHWGGPWGGPWGPYGWGYRHGPWMAPPAPDVYLHEVALLIRDAATGKPLYETRASSDGWSDGGDRLLSAMFEAAMKDFPQSNGQAHAVRVEMTPVPSAATPTPAPAASAVKP